MSVHKIQATVRGKHMKPALFGLLGQKPMVELEWTDPNYELSPRFADLPLGTMAEYHSLHAGDVILVTMKVGANGLLHP